MGRVADDLVARVLGGGAVALDDLFTASDTLNDGDEPPSTRVDLLRAMWLVDGGCRSTVELGVCYG